MSSMDERKHKDYFLLNVDIKEPRNMFLLNTHYIFWRYNHGWKEHTNIKNFHEAIISLFLGAFLGNEIETSFCDWKNMATLVAKHWTTQKSTWQKC